MVPADIEPPGGDRALEALLVEPQAGIGHARLPADALHHVLGIGHARHPLRIHERHDLNVGRARSSDSASISSILRAVVIGPFSI